MRGINQWQLISNYKKLQYAFVVFLKVSVCYSAWLISGSYWIIVPCLQLIKPTLTYLSPLCLGFCDRKREKITLSPDFFKFCLEVAWLCQNKASPVGWANNPAQIPPPQVKQGFLLSLSDCHAETRLGKRHKHFKASLGCSVPVLFLCRPIRLKHFGEEQKHTYTNLCTPQNVPTAQVHFKRFCLVGFG